jgi:signal transduction histidine kinase
LLSYLSLYAQESKLLDYKEFNVPYTNNSQSPFQYASQQSDFFKKYAPFSLNYISKDSIHKSPSLTSIVDTLLENAKNSYIPRNDLPFLDLYYNKPTYRSLILKIDSLPKTESSYFSKDAEKVKREILGIADCSIKIGTLLYFAKHFFNRENFNLLNNYFYSESKKIIDTISDWKKKATAWITIGDFYLGIDDLVDASQAYVTSGYIIVKKADLQMLALIFEKLSIVFEQRNIVSYLSEATALRFYILKTYSLINDSSAIINAQIEYALTQSHYSTLVSDLNKKKALRNEIINTAAFVYNYSTRKRVSTIVKINFYSLLADYFSDSEDASDLTVALQYSQACIITILNETPRYNLDDLIRAQEMLTWVHAKLKNSEKSLYYNNLGLAFARNRNNTLWFYAEILNRSNILGLQGFTRAAIHQVNLFTEAIEADSTVIFKRRKYILYSNYLKSRLYQDINKKDSADHFLSKAKALESDFTEELKQIVIRLSELSQFLTYDRIDTLEHHLTILDSSLLMKRSELDSTISKLSLYKDSLNTLSALLVKKRTELKQINSTLQNTNNSLAQTKGELKLAILFRTLSTILVIILLLYIAWLIYKRYIHKIEKANIEARILKYKGQSHEIRHISDDLNEKISYSLSNINSNSSKVDIENIFSDLKYASNISNNYIQSHYDSVRDPLQSVEKEIEAAENFLLVYRALSLRESLSVNIHNKIPKQSPVLNQNVPSTFLTNFIMNSIQHGSKRRDIYQLDIEITSVEIKNGYRITIEDNGCGIIYSKRAGDYEQKKHSGINMAKDLIKQFNYTQRPKKIKFQEANIIDKSCWGQQGTRVTFDLIVH